MALNRTLRLNFRGNVTIRYKNTGFPLTKSVLDSIQRAVTLTLTHSAGANKADLVYHHQHRLINTFKIYDLDDYSLKDVWGEGLNFDAVKFFLLENIQTNLETIGNSINYTFKKERGVVGPKGFRIAAEPRGAGVQVETSSGSAEEGQLVVSTNSDVTYNLILVGSSEEQSSNSG